MSAAMLYDDDYRAISSITTEYDTGMSMEYTSTIKSNRSLVIYLILSILTCGIYSLHFFNRCGRELNLIAMNDGRKTANFYLVFIFSLLLGTAVCWFPVKHLIANGGSFAFLEQNVYRVFFESIIIFILFVVSLLPIFIWLRNWTKRADDELIKRKTGTRLTLGFYWTVCCFMPLSFVYGAVLVWELMSNLSQPWMMPVGCGLCLAAAIVCVIIFVGHVITVMNTLSRCAVYQNVDYK